VSLGARLLLAMNKLFPRPIDYGGDTADSYSKWEYESGEMMHKLHFDDKVDFTDARVLDIGCGYGGKTAFYLDRKPAQVVGIDLMPDHVTQAANYTNETHARAAHAAFVASDASALPFADNSFDVITATDTFEHFADPGEVLSEVARILKPGGHLVFYFTPHRSPLGSHLYKNIFMPWCHMLVPEDILFEAVEMSVEREHLDAGTPITREKAREIAAGMRHLYQTTLNGMTVHRFLSLANAQPNLQFSYFYRKPLKGALTRPFTQIPPFDEFITTLAVGILQKRS
jgi:ubiquinone/menaquinone biosynthesis C-methylase UbiE